MISGSFHLVIILIIDIWSCIGQVASARSKIQAAAKILNEKLEARERLKESEEAAKKSKETSDEKLFQVRMIDGADAPFQ
jgi:hypothetical protein